MKRLIFAVLAAVLTQIGPAQASTVQTFEFTQTGISGSWGTRSISPLGTELPPLELLVGSYSDATLTISITGRDLNGDGIMSWCNPFSGPLDSRKCVNGQSESGFASATLRFAEPISSFCNGAIVTATSLPDCSTSFLRQVIVPGSNNVFGGGTVDTRTGDFSFRWSGSDEGTQISASKRGSDSQSTISFAGFPPIETRTGSTNPFTSPSFPAAVIPLPATAWLILSGLAALGLSRARGRRTRAA